MIKKTLRMALIDLKKVYNRTLLGWFWIIAKPATTIFVYWFAFAIGLRVSGKINGHDYFFWLIAGMIPWFLISEIIATSPSAFKKYNYLVTKMKFPILTIPVFTVFSRVIVHFLLLIIMLILFELIGNGLTINMLQIIPLFISTFYFLSVISIIFAFLGSISKDIGEFIKTIITPILFLTPIIWDINKVKIGWLVRAQQLNPIHFIVNGYRNILIYERPFYTDLISLALYILIMILLTIVASTLYRKLKEELPDYL